MKKVMIVQPMAGRDEETISKVRAHAVELLESEGYEVINTHFKDEWTTQESLEESGIKHIPVLFLAKSLEKMAECDLVYFCNGWAAARGCKLEHRVVREYGITPRYERGVQHSRYEGDGGSEDANTTR